jgi:hypothetical protein
MHVTLWTKREQTFFLLFENSSCVLAGARIQRVISKGHGQMKTLFTDSQIELLRKEYEKIKSIDPALPTYKKLTDFLNSLPQENLKQLADAKIKWISSLALNRVKK